jgi:hypothetical protein
MKISFVTWLLLCVTGVAMANGIDREDMPVEAAVQDKQKAPPRVYARKTMRLPQGDLRQCLELPTNEAIIRCSEGRSPRKRR